MLMPDLILTTMKISFATNEIKSAVRKCKSNKNPGKDEIFVELINSAPDIVYEQIAKIYNSISENSEHLNEITHVILRLLPKPGKPKDPPSNLRPITLHAITFF